MQKSLFTTYALFSKWLFITLFLVASNALFTDIIIAISPNKPIKYSLFFLHFCIGVYSLYNLMQLHLTVSQLIKHLHNKSA
ncbi:hypothetical protein A1D25_04975 [Ursidibacter arcticus]|uniref:hypothetical protein n=1 Tax=Ursidibacter arcticus TaxID=1524965 RepID=UPI0012FCE335|nr:hypothetical protein [Ursidibacter arcticus]KAE9535300.1 hypothetical protein A1D25_04975 [Ursidibacter arcticus]